MADGIPTFPEIFATSRFEIALHLDGSKDLVDAVFQECQGFKRTQKSIEIYEVTPPKLTKGKAINTQGHPQIIQTKIPGNVEISNITLKRGMTESMAFWEWFQSVEEGNWAKRRKKNGTLTIYNLCRTAAARFEFHRAWPISYKIGDFSATKEEHEIEELELAVESFIRVPLGGS